MASEAKISVKFFVDKDENRVVFAEANKDFLDTLFSFLTLPLSTVIELINDSSALQSMTNIYKSVKSLDLKHLETEACRNMLLRPLSAGALRCEDLKLNIGNTNPRRFYHCSKNDCTIKGIIYISLVPDVRCWYCEQSMYCTNSWWKGEEDSGRDRGGVFVRGGEPTFIIMDDLSVMPASVASTATLLQNNMADNRRGTTKLMTKTTVMRMTVIRRMRMAIRRTTMTLMRMKMKPETLQLSGVSNVFGKIPSLSMQAVTNSQGTFCLNVCRDISVAPRVIPNSKTFAPISAVVCWLGSSC